MHTHRSTRRVDVDGGKPQLSLERPLRQSYALRLSVGDDVDLPPEDASPCDKYGVRDAVPDRTPRDGPDPHHPARPDRERNGIDVNPREQPRDDVECKAPGSDGEEHRGDGSASLTNSPAGVAGDVYLDPYPTANPPEQGLDEPDRLNPARRDGLAAVLEQSMPQSQPVRRLGEREIEPVTEGAKSGAAEGQHDR